MAALVDTEAAGGDGSDDESSEDGSGQGSGSESEGSADGGVAAAGGADGEEGASASGSDAGEDEEEDDDGEWSSLSEEDGGDEVDEARSAVEREKEREARRSTQFVAPPQATKDVLDMHLDDLESDDEGAKNTIGTVPLEWYKEHDHIGYDLSGKEVKRVKGADGIDNYLRAADDPHFKWTIVDERNGEEIKLSARDVELAKRVRAGLFPHPEFNAYPEYVDWFTRNKSIHPMTNYTTEPKRRFQPSKWEKMKVVKLMRAIKEGRITKEKPKEEDVYMMWGEDGMAIGYEARKHAPPVIKPPKPAPPGHAASYNPPAEYLFTEEERKQWEDMDPEERPLDFVPQRYKTLRAVPAYDNFVRDRFDRCLDLYLAPRTVRKRLNVDPESLLPKLPDPSELRPFPTTEAVEYVGHTGRVRSMSVDASGQYLCTGGDDGTVRLWEVETGRELGCIDCGDVVHCVAWNPNPSLHFVAVAVGDRMLLVSTGTAVGDQAEETFAVLSGARTEAAIAARAEAEPVPDTVFGAAAAGKEVGGEAEDAAGGAGSEHSGSDSGDGSDSDDSANDGAADEPSAKRKIFSKWENGDDALESAAAFVEKFVVAVNVRHTTMVKRLAWHRKGDYIAAVSPGAQYASIVIHQVSKRVTQLPFRKTKRLVQGAAFHPSKPLLFIATQTQVLVYHLLNEELVKKLTSGVKWISDFDVHSTGDHVIVGSYDTRVVWFDMEMSQQAFKTLRYHKEAVRGVNFHRHYPLMATCGDDGAVHVFHSKVYTDVFENPLVVPVKVLRGHTVTADKLGVLSCRFHPTQPWLFTCGADRKVKLWQNIP